MSMVSRGLGAFSLRIGGPAPSLNGIKTDAKSFGRPFAVNRTAGPQATIHANLQTSSIVPVEDNHPSTAGGIVEFSP